MNPWLMILASLGSVVVMGGVFVLQQTLRRRRAARRRAMQRARRYEPVEAVEAAPKSPFREELTRGSVAER